MTGLIVWRGFVTVVLRWRVRSGTTPRFGAWSRVRGSRISSSFGSTWWLRFVTTRVLIKTNMKTNHSHVIVDLKISFYNNTNTYTQAARVYWQWVTNKPLPIHCLRSSVSAFAAEAVVSWAWQIFALLGYLDWTSRTAINECVPRLTQNIIKRLKSFYKLAFWKLLLQRWVDMSQYKTTECCLNNGRLRVCMC